MAVIGNSATQQAFTPAVDYFSGNGSTTAFTLSRPVASVAQVEAVIDNVVQNPSSAYTVSSNTITFTSAPLAGTNNIYVRYTSPITQVIAPSQGTVQTAQLGNITNIASGNSSLTLQTGSSPTTAVTIDTSQNVLVGTTTTTNNIRLNQKVAVVTTGSGVYGGISNTSYNGTSAGVGPIVDLQRSRGTTDGSMTAVASGDTLGYMVFRGADGTQFIDASYITGQVDGSVTAGTVPGRLVFNTSGAERMRIDSSGRITTPYQPYFYVRTNLAGDNQTQSNPFVNGSVATNTGSCYTNSTGRFTAPIAGVYVFACNPGYKQTSYDMGFRWRVNGNDTADMVRLVGTPPNSHSGGTYTFLLQLAANDYVDMAQQFTYYHSNATFNFWSGYLLG